MAKLAQACVYEREPVLTHLSQHLHYGGATVGL